MGSLTPLPPPTRRLLPTHPHHPLLSACHPACPPTRHPTAVEETTCNRTRHKPFSRTTKISAEERPRRQLEPAARRGPASGLPRDVYDGGPSPFNGSTDVSTHRHRRSARPVRPSPFRPPVHHPCRNTIVPRTTQSATRNGRHNRARCRSFLLPFSRFCLSPPGSLPPREKLLPCSPLAYPSLSSGCHWTLSSPPR